VRIRPASFPVQSQLTRQGRSTRNGQWIERFTLTTKWHDEAEWTPVLGPDGLVRATAHSVLCLLDSAAHCLLLVSKSPSAHPHYRFFSQLTDMHGQPLVFQGNSDKQAVVAHCLPQLVFTRHVRLVPLAWHDAISARIELLAVDVGSPVGIAAGTIPDAAFTGQPDLCTHHLSCVP
jgi:hypothetical protein